MLAVDVAWAFLRRIPWQLYVAAAIAAAAWWGADHFYDHGVADSEAAIKAAALTERARQAGANEIALKTGAEIVTGLAQEALGAVIGRLNVSYAGRAVFAGDAGDGAALAPAADVIAEATAILEAAPTAGAGVARESGFISGPLGFLLFKSPILLTTSPLRVVLFTWSPHSQSIDGSIGQSAPLNNVKGRRRNRVNCF